MPNLSGLVKGKDPVKIDQVDRRNGVAFVDSFLHEGRRYNVSTDLRVIPADRFRPIRGSDFHGYIIGKDRLGNEIKTGLISVSIGIVSNVNTQITHVAQISETGAELKKYAKSFQHSNYVRDKRSDKRKK